MSRLSVERQGEIEKRSRDYAADRSAFAVKFAGVAIDLAEAVELAIRRAYLDGALAGFDLASKVISEEESPK